MTNTAPDPQDQSSIPPDPQAPGNSSGSAPAGTPAPQPAPTNPAPAGAQATIPEKKGRFLGLVGSFFGGIAQDVQRDRELNREIKRAKALATQSTQEELAQTDLGQASPEDPGDLLQQERAKRIRMISDFTDIKETLDHRIKRYVSGFACAIVPWLLVIFLTSDVGEYFAGKPFTTSDFQVVGIFGITSLLEVVVAVVTNAWGNTVHDLNATDVAADKTKMRERARTQAAAWAVLSIVSGFALFMFLLQKSADNAAIASGVITAAQVAVGLHAAVDYTLNANMINVGLRVLGTLAIDPACVFAVHATTKNLDQFLKQQNQITMAINQISDAFDKQQEAAARAEMRQKENARFLELKGNMDNVNAAMMGKMGDKLLTMSDQMFDHLQLPPARIVSGDDDEDENGRGVRRLRRG